MDNGEEQEDEYEDNKNRSRRMCRRRWKINIMVIRRKIRSRMICRMRRR